MKKTITALIIFIMLTSLTTLAVSAAGIGSAGAVLAEDVTLIKTGLRGQSLPFSDTDFKTALACPSIDSITVTKLPGADEDVLMLGERKLSEGQTVRRKNLGSLIFIPASADVSEASFSFKASGSGSDCEIVCRMRFIDKINYAPTAKVSEKASAAVTTQRGISAYGELSATDPEGDALEFIIVSYPTLGTLTLVDKEKGYYRYNPLH